MSSINFFDVPETINFAEEELKILCLWEKIDAFQSCLKQSKGKSKYSFYDGPPFATGLPHYGHILTGTVKDIITRYAHQLGYYVERRFGWDCHGLPIEMEIDKIFNIKGSDDIKKIGISVYNNECRKIVTRYINEWRTIMGRIGRWIDFDNDYKTMYPWFMESVWWVFKQLYLKGLVYHGNKIMPYSTVCKTPLSNFESGQNYKTVTDPAIIVALPIIGDSENAALLIWTTTPWTLPANLAACVNPKLIYVRVKEISSNNVYVLLKTRVEAVFEIQDYEIIEDFSGSVLKDTEYVPLFPYYNHLRSKGAFRVLVDAYVSDECGTGIVHQAPYFGEEDYRVCLNAGLISVDDESVCPIDENGCFTDTIVEFEGQYFKDVDPQIIKFLKINNRLIRHSKVEHSYPFCWRSDTRLIYKAVSSWFIRVQHLSKMLLENTSETYWVPDFVKEKRFSNWLKEARDWAISRNRYWGTPIPIWMSKDGDEICCVGSIAELEGLAGRKINDLHREHIDNLTIPSKIPGNPPLHRIPEVFDCWFQSGSMPYAQQHFPFENIDKFYDNFPVDIIAEGIDQTRGWFYTLLVISTALFGKAPFKNLIATGLVLASDGQKMSKRKKNYPDPTQVISKYGADALRLYLINSPVVRAENLNFKEEGVLDMVKYVLLPWFNTYRFFMQNIDYCNCKKMQQFVLTDDMAEPSHMIDVWIISITDTLLEYINQEMNSYHLYNIIPRCIKYFDNLTNWYLRMNRKRLRGETTEKDHHQALLTLFSVLYTITRAMAPFAPFFSEYVYQTLKQLSNSDIESVHFLTYPKSKAKREVNIERAVSRMQDVIQIGRKIRDRKTIPTKCPLPEMVVIVQNEEYVNDIQYLRNYVCCEMNVRNLRVSTDKSEYGISLRAKPDYKVLGRRFKSEYKLISKAIESLEDHEIKSLLENGHYHKNEQHIDTSVVRIAYNTNISASNKYELEVRNEVIVLLDVHPTEDMVEEGTARELINRIQRLRKKCHLSPIDEIEVYYEASNDFKEIIEKHAKFIQNAIKTTFLPIECYTNNDNGRMVVVDNQFFKNGMLNISIVSAQNKILPFVKWANVVYNNKKGLILLEAKSKLLTVKELELHIKCLFDLYEDISLWSSNGKIITNDDINAMSGETIIVLSTHRVCQIVIQKSYPVCKFLNFIQRGLSGTIILENPVGVDTICKKDYINVIREWFVKK